ncbi:MAG: regulatory protein RecX [Patescibacteria group bacterium]
MSEEHTSLKKITQKAMDLLARREHASFELKQKLLKKGFDEEMVNKELALLQSKGLQDDNRYAELYIRMRINKGFGAIKIRAELLEKKLNKQDIDLFLNNKNINWKNQASLVRLKKFGAQHPVAIKEKAKQLRFLQSRGFTTEQIRSVINYED